MRFPNPANSPPPALSLDFVRQWANDASHAHDVETVIIRARQIERTGARAIVTFQRNPATGAICGLAITTDSPRATGVRR